MLKLDRFFGIAGGFFFAMLCQGFFFGYELNVKNQRTHRGG